MVSTRHGSIARLQTNLVSLSAAASPFYLANTLTSCCCKTLSAQIIFYAACVAACSVTNCKRMPCTSEHDLANPVPSRNYLTGGTSFRLATSLLCDAGMEAEQAEDGEAGLKPAAQIPRAADAFYAKLFPALEVHFRPTHISRCLQLCALTLA